jgi:hypothetical protein
MWQRIPSCPFRRQTALLRSLTSDEQSNLDPDDPEIFVPPDFLFPDFPDIAVTTADCLLNAGASLAARFLRRQCDIHPSLNLDEVILALVQTGAHVCAICELLIYFEAKTIVSLHTTFDSLFALPFSELHPIVRLCAIVLSFPCDCGHVLVRVISVLAVDSPRDIARGCLFALRSAARANYDELRPLFLQVVPFILPKLLDHADVSSAIIEHLTEQMVPTDPLAVIARLSVLFAVSQTSAVRVNGLRAMANICAIDFEWQRQWREDSALVDCLCGFLPESAFGERAAAIVLLNALFEDGMERMPETVREAIFDMIRAGDDESAQAGLQLIRHAGGMDEQEVDDVIDSICTHCSGSTYARLVQVLAEPGGNLNSFEF